jgi:hypothetical protein
VTAPTPTKRLCVFCHEASKISLEHLIPTWVVSGEDASQHLYYRESGGPDYEVREDMREGAARDLTAKGPCQRCNNGWMNAMDHGVLDVLSPQLIRGKKVKLTKTKKMALAAWAVKYTLMGQLTHWRDRRFAIPEDEYLSFYERRPPSDSMRLWAGYMEPPGQRGGPMPTFTDYTLNETFYDPSALERAGLSAELASKDYNAVFRFGHCVIGLCSAQPQILQVARLLHPYAWVQIWPAVGATEWPPASRCRQVESIQGSPDSHPPAQNLSPVNAQRGPRALGSALRPSRGSRVAEKLPWSRLDELVRGMVFR